VIKGTENRRGPILGVEGKRRLEQGKVLQRECPFIAGDFPKGVDESLRRLNLSRC